MTVVRWYCHNVLIYHYMKWKLFHYLVSRKHGGSEACTPCVDHLLITCSGTSVFKNNDQGTENFVTNRNRLSDKSGEGLFTQAFSVRSYLLEANFPLLVSCRMVFDILKQWRGVN